MPYGAACSRWARERAAGGPAQESAGQGSRKRARGRRRLAGLRSASAIAGFSPFEMEEMNAYLHPTEPLLPFSSYNEQDRRRVRAGADTLRHSTTGAAGGRRRAHTHTHTHTHTHCKTHAHSTTHEGTWFSSFSYFERISDETSRHGIRRLS